MYVPRDQMASFNKKHADIAQTVEVKVSVPALQQKYKVYEDA